MELFASRAPHLLSLPEPIRSDMLDLQVRAQIQGYEQTYPQLHRYVIYHGGQPSGIIQLNWAETVRLVDLIISPDRRGQGLGETVLRDLQRWASRPIELHVDHGNPARRLYDRLGFTAIRDVEHRTLMRWTPAADLG